MLPPAGQIFEKWHLLENCDNFLYSFVCSSMGLAGMLPPAGQSFEQLHFLEMLSIWAEKNVTLQAGV